MCVWEGGCGVGVDSCMRACVRVYVSKTQNMFVVHVYNIDLVYLASCDLNLFSHCYCRFPLEVSHRGCSLHLKFLLRGELCLYVRGSSFRNISLSLLF